MKMDKITDMNWWKNAVIYEFYVDKFAGDFKGLIAKLDYLKYLGVDTLWVLPHYPSPMIDGGYDISDYKNIRKELGTMQDFDRFVSEAHQGGFKIVLDLVLNHTSDKHPWFTEARASKTNPRREWYLWSDETERFSEAFVHFSDIKKTNWIANEETHDYYYATFYPEQPDLNWDNTEVFKEMISVIDFWLSKGVDGFRLDAISRLIKRDGTNCFALVETHDVVKRIRKHIDINYPNAVLIAEAGGWPGEAKTFFGDDDECQIVLNFPLAVNLLSGISSGDESNALTIWSESVNLGQNSRWGVFLTSHDSVDLFFLKADEDKNKLKEINSLMQRFGSTGGESFAARLAEICGGERHKILWAHEKLLELPAVPILYYGNEIGMRNVELSSKPSDFREYVRGKFDWVEAEKQIKDSESILNGIRNLILNRKRQMN